ncbi:MAG TPA: hypothetical protein DCM28_09960 [Phycisphaerales bacterium]|nr:hypothetical protein [Phycisphaerales bacterium]HCD32889.1 hypothetical protein [Phycisphaerales bacterium]
MKTRTTGVIPAEGQHNVESEMHAESDLQKHADRRQDDGENHANNVHKVYFNTREGIKMRKLVRGSAQVRS